MRIHVISLIAATLAIAALPAAGQAAPQILGLAATAAPLPLQCADGVCSVEVSGICLQKHRPAPDAGTAYRAVSGADITLMPRQVSVRSGRGISAGVSIRPGRF